MPDEIIQIDKQAAPTFAEIGTTGLKQYSGRINEEFLRQLRGIRAEKAFSEMAANDATIGGILFAVEMLLRSVTWRTEPFDESESAIEQAEFVDEVFEDMSHTWEDFISEVLSMLIYGWAYFETVYKRRGGFTNNPATRSRFTDNRIGLRKIAIRGQESRIRWQFGPDGGVEGMLQRIPGARQIFIPIEKALLFRTTSVKNSPEGKSILRNAYISWFYKKRIQEIEAIGIERDLAGFPVIEAPARIMGPNAKSEEKTQYENLKEIVRNIRRDEQEGLVMPGDRYPGTDIKMFELTLLSTGGRRQFDTTKIIDRYDNRIATVVLADFIMLGQGKTGSFALSKDKTSLFTTVLMGWNDAIAAVINRHLVPRLFLLNGFGLDMLPKRTPGMISEEDVNKFMMAVKDAAAAGFQLAGDEETENVIRDKLGFPEITEDMLEADDTQPTEEDQEELQEQIKSVV